MKMRFLVFGIVATAVLAWPRLTSAQVSTSDFNDLKDTVQKLSQQMQELMKTHAQDQKTHEEDQKKIESLQQQLGETRTAVTNVDE